MGEREDENKQHRIEAVLKSCEKEEHQLHKRFSVILKVIAKRYGVDSNLISEMEDLYIQKGLIYCSHSYKVGFDDGNKRPPLS